MKLAFVFGTRPELLKLIPIIKLLEHRCPNTVILFDTQQQQELTPAVFREYDIEYIPNIRFESYRNSLSGQLASQLGHLDGLLDDCAGVVVQGDTMSAVAGALVGFYQELPVIHVEAGLRSHDVSQPFPEEMNRRLISNIASLHLAPTDREMGELISCGIAEEHIIVVGNPLADLCRGAKGSDKATWDVLVTMHRRENRSSGIRELCHALDELTGQNPDCRFAVIQHSHPDVQEKFQRHLPACVNLDYVSPMKHQDFLKVMLGSKLVMTDSGGVQEEAAMFGIPTMVLRDLLDRQDGVTAGTTRKAGIHKDEIVSAAGQILRDSTQVSRTPVFPAESPSELIVDQILNYFSLKRESVA
jgi:UDP-N-acetylglucosamine 2-epimerase (non-hydrolysing)